MPYNRFLSFELVPPIDGGISLLENIISKLNKYIKCPIRKKEIRLSAEEEFRQLYLQKLITQFAYSEKNIQLEYPISLGNKKQYADIVIFEKERPDVPYIIADFKQKSKLKARKQLELFGNATAAPILIWANEQEEFFWYKKANGYLIEIQKLLKLNEKLNQIVNQKFTIKDLEKQNQLQVQQKSLKAKILEIEDEVLANAGVDVFEEVFKLIFIKLYDEWLSGQDKSRFLEFRHKAETENELHERMNSLLNNAMTEWIHVFPAKTKLNLSKSHLAVCISSLQNLKLLGSNLDIIDDAFEYLINKSNKGEKGQYFTPRYVIDMCIKMLNPSENETIIDTAAGSAGFTMHSTFYVWQKILLDNQMPLNSDACQKFVQEKVFSIDFDEKTIQIARALMQIIGGQNTNVLNLNSLDYERWNETSRQHKWKIANKQAFDKLKNLRTKKTSFKNFEFDIVLTNPPFGGDIKESRILHKYNLAKKANDKWHKTMSSDILFIERNLQFLKAGGRMAIILPQGRFNNSGDKYIRDFITQECRILAVVSLHENTFKPHTATKTSVLFIQKWTDTNGINPKLSDYNIFFATSQKSGKDNGGDKIHILNSKKEKLAEKNGELIIDHDLFNQENFTKNGIAEEFIEFGKNEGFSFLK